MFVGIIILVLLLVVLTEGLPDLIEGIGQLGEFLAMVLRVAFVTIAKIIWFLLRHLLRLGWRGLSLGTILLFYFLLELLRGEPPANDEDADEPAEEEQGDDELCAAARTLLGLPDDFTRVALDAAYKRAIRKAHPDAGGSIDEAQAVNMARELLLRRLVAA